MRRATPGLVAAFLATALGGCSLLAGRAAGGSIDESLEELTEEESARDVATILRHPQIQAATQEFVRGLADVAAEELYEEERLAAIQESFGGFSEQMVELLGTRMGAMSDRLLARLDEAVRQLARDATSPEAQRELETVVTGVTQVMVRTAVEEMRREMPGAMASALRDERVQEALRDSSRSIAHGMVVGMDEGLQARQEHMQAGGESFLIRRMQSLSDRGATLTSRLRWGLYLAIGAVIVSLALLAWQLRKARREAHRREGSLVLLASTLKTMEDGHWSPELLEMLHRHFRHEPGAEYLREVLRDTTGRAEQDADREPPGRPPVGWRQAPSH